MLFCSKSRNNWDKPSERYINWFATHIDQCAINHANSSEAMEKEAEADMFDCSIEKRGLKYTIYVGDCDS